MIEPYWSDNNCTIYNADCRDVLPTLGKVDLVLTDPPFFMPAAHYSSRTTWQRSWGDAMVLGHWWGSVLDLVIPHLTVAGALLTFCDGESYPVFYPEAYRRFDAVSAVVWDKQAIGMGARFRRQFELVMYARWKDSYWDQNNKSQPDVMRCSSIPATARLHPVDKPTDLLTRLLLPTTTTDATVLDPFMGGGSAMVAAKACHRKAIGIDTEESYCEAAAKRLSQEVLDFGAAS